MNHHLITKRERLQYSHLPVVLATAQFLISTNPQHGVGRNSQEASVIQRLQQFELLHLQVMVPFRVATDHQPGSNPGLGAFHVTCRRGP